MWCLLRGRHLTWCVLTGLGYASQVMILHGCVYYIVILAWALFYLVYSFQAELPWSHCNNTWNTGQHRRRASRFSKWQRCFFKNFVSSYRNMHPVYPPQPNGQQQPPWERHLSCHGVLGVSVTFTLSRMFSGFFFPVLDCLYWLCVCCRREVLNLSGNLDKLGPISWKLALCLAAIWVICYFCVWKGVKSTGKVSGNHTNVTCVRLHKSRYVYHYNVLY